MQYLYALNKKIKKGIENIPKSASKSSQAEWPPELYRLVSFNIVPVSILFKNAFMDCKYKLNLAFTSVPEILFPEKKRASSLNLTDTTLGIPSIPESCSNIKTKVP